MEQKDEEIEKYIEFQKRQREIIKSNKRQKANINDNENQTVVNYGNLAINGSSFERNLKRIDNEISKLNFSYYSLDKIRLSNLFYEKGLSYKILKKYVEAIKAFIRSYEINPKFKECYIRILECKSLIDEHEIVIKEDIKFKVEIELNPEIKYKKIKIEAFECFKNGLLNKKSRKYSEAIDDFTAAINISPLFFEAYMNRSTCKDLSGIYSLDQQNSDLEYAGKVKKIIEEREEINLKKNKLSRELYSITNENIKQEAIDYFKNGLTKKQSRNYLAAISDFDNAIKIFPAFLDAYIYRSNCKELYGWFHILEIEKDLKMASGAIGQLSCLKQIRDYIYSKINSNLADQRSCSFKKEIVKDDYLSTIFYELRHNYTDVEIALACGYFDIDVPREELDLIILKYGFAALNKLKKIPRLDLYNLAISSALNLKSEVEVERIGCNNPKSKFYIFQNRLCVDDSSFSCGYFYIPQKKVEISKVWDYSKTDLQNYSLESLAKEKYYLGLKKNINQQDFIQGIDNDDFFALSGIKRHFNSFYMEAEDEAKEEIKEKGFSEPMYRVPFEGKQYIDNRLNYEDIFGEDELAEFYGVNPYDCIEDENGSILLDYWSD